MVDRRTLEFALGVVVAGVVAGALSLHVATPYSLAAAIAASMPSFVRTSSGLDRNRYLAARSTNAQVLDGALSAGIALLAGVGAGYLAISLGYGGVVGAALAAAFAVLAGQSVFYARNGEFLQRE
jgi:hypothetical protein